MATKPVLIRQFGEGVPSGAMVIRALSACLGVAPWAGRVARCFDNSAAGSFWSSLKRQSESSSIAHGGEARWHSS